MIKIKKYLALVVVFITIVSCCNYNYRYGYVTEDSYKRVSKSLEYVLKKDELFLIFTTNFNMDKIKVIDNDNILYDDFITTDKSGKAKVFKININSDLKIEFNNIKEILRITKDQMKSYKYIYLKKANKKVTIEFSNNGKVLGALPENQ